jgi:hypothetical protein
MADPLMEVKKNSMSDDDEYDEDDEPMAMPKV